MTARAGTSQPTRAHRPGRIIERPRLIKLLDEAEAPVILIVAPAGYGKTTLARQWARRLTGVIWVSCTPSHRDVVTFSEDVAAGIDALGGDASRFVGEYVRARSNPQRAAREIGLMLARRLSEAPAQWLVIDDYHELTDSRELQELIRLLQQRSQTRMLVVSRVRPEWAKARELVYDQLSQVGPPELALTAHEITAVLGQRPELEPLVRRAKGWPAVVALAGRLTSINPDDLLPSTLHQYVAEELYSAASSTLKRQLVDLALLPDLSDRSLARWFGESARSVMHAAAELGFVTLGTHAELHPMLREFLLAKLAEQSQPSRARHAVDAAANAEQWPLALELVLRFDLTDMINPILQRAYKPLIRSGRLETLSAFARQARAKAGFPLAAVEVIDAEVAMRNGELRVAASLATHAHERLPDGHELKCRASLIAGRAHVLTASIAESIACYQAAIHEALDDPDRVEGAFGLAMAQPFGEQGDPRAALAELERLRSLDPTNLVRHATATSNLRRMAGFSGEPFLDAALNALPLTPDPHVRTAFSYSSSYLLCVRGDYLRAETLLELFERDVTDYDLDFARPFLNWTKAFACLGLRRFGDADRYLQRVEDAAADPSKRSHGFNARILRARLMLQTGEASDAAELLDAPAEATVYRSWRGELKGTRALAFACLGERDRAHEAADEALSLTGFVEVVALVRGAQAIAAADTEESARALRRLFEEATQFDAWDPVLCALRASRELAEHAASDPVVKPLLRDLLVRTGDTALARQLGLQTRTVRAPDAVLSPRELEVLGLMSWTAPCSSVDS